MNKHVLALVAVAAALLLVVLVFTDRGPFAWTLAALVLVAVGLGDLIRVKVFERHRHVG